MNFSNHHLLHLLNQQVRTLNKQVNERLKVHGLFLSQWSILYCLYKKGPMTQTSIWQYLNVEAPTVTRTITRLVEKGWVTREKGSDKRERIIEISNEAHAKVAELVEIIRTYEDEILIGLSAKEEEQLRLLLRKLGSKERNNNYEEQ
ncbi:MarR family winged helix-turn-helix transcriptional regulator [Halobacillus amylolyticus]|uniref:MarR family transcriptional regulator n=1 Tax=Halobacillus amylolyticus TaxID=2932259 RepID=A0ABY4H7Q8_9BACI|nr:MarR family transcriptional regulator [Halobacillus amylolyticus]UOR10899.1 MarR family transcriptional regulator [Halobacillus amylolyticus]